MPPRPSRTDANAHAPDVLRQLVTRDVKKYASF